MRCYWVGAEFEVYNLGLGLRDEGFGKWGQVLEFGDQKLPARKESFTLLLHRLRDYGVYRA